MKRSTSRIVGWVLSGLLAAFLIVASGVPKFIEWEGKAEAMGHLGWSTDTIFVVGLVQVGIAVLLLIPRTAFIGAVLLTAYLGGATAAHVRIGEAFFFPIILGVLAWIAVGLRDRRIFALAWGSPCPNAPASVTP